MENGQGYQGADFRRVTLDRRNAEALSRYQQHPRRPEILGRWYDKPTIQRLQTQLRLGVQLTGIPL